MLLNALQEFFVRKQVPKFLTSSYEVVRYEFLYEAIEPRA